MDEKQMFVNAVQDGIREGIKTKFQGYNSALDKLLDSCLAEHAAEFRSILSGALKSAIDDAEFRSEIFFAIRHKLAQLLVQRFGGELEKQINALKSDPATRARITLAIEQIVGSAVVA